MAAMMFKFWKNTWRKRDSQQTEPLRPNDGAVLSGSAASQSAAVAVDLGSHTGTSADTAQTNGSSGPCAEPSSGSVRKRDQADQASSGNDKRPTKRLKLDPLFEERVRNRAEEIVVFYDPQPQVSITRLYSKLLLFDPDRRYFRRFFKNARHALQDVGACGSDLAWRKALNDIEAVEVPANDSETGEKIKTSNDMAKAKANVVSTIKNYIFAMPNIDPSSRGFNVTPKFLKLIQVLKACEPYGESFRGIIFVHRRIVANTITDVIKGLDELLGFLRPQAVHGHLNDNETLEDIMHSFRMGTINLLIATKFAEDIEFLPANCVIRYDLYESHVSYALSRARAKDQQSHHVLLAERGNDMHRRVTSAIASLDPDLQRWADSMKGDDPLVPPATIKENIEPYRSDSEDEDDPSQYLMEGVSGGRIYPADAVSVICQVTAQPYDTSENSEINVLFTYEEVYERKKRKVICTIHFPHKTSWPYKKFVGSRCKSRWLARRTACYDLCRDLYERGLLDYRVFRRGPIVSTRGQRVTYLSPVVKEEVSDDEGERRSNPARPRYCPSKSPDFWINCLSAQTSVLYPTKVILETSQTFHGKFQPVLVLTKLPLPDIPGFDLFIAQGTVQAELKAMAPITISSAQLDQLCEYTIRIYRLVCNKPAVCDVADMQYFFAPTLPDTGVLSTGEHTEAQIDWKRVEEAVDDWVKPVPTDSVEELERIMEDAIVQDRANEWIRRFQVVRIRPDLNPHSSMPSTVHGVTYQTPLERHHARRPFFTGLKNDSQPLIETVRVLQSLNHLSPLSMQQTLDNDIQFRIPECSWRLTIPASTYRSVLLLPSIMRRVDEMLLVKEVNAKYFDHIINEKHLHAALTSASAGIEYNYERQELLGDAFLKYVSSIYLFVTRPLEPEGAMHLSRQRLVSNFCLLKNAERRGLSQYIQTTVHTFKSWIPPFMQPPPGYPIVNRSSARKYEAMLERPVAADNDAMEITPDSNREAQPAVPEQPAPIGIVPERVEREPRILGDKMIADVSEAIVAAAYYSGGRDTALGIAKRLNIPLPHVDGWIDFGRKTVPPPPSTTAELKPGTLRTIEEMMGEKFRNPRFLAQAMTHTSVRHGLQVTCYERLEFLGDAILDFFVTEHLYKEYPLYGPGPLSVLKSAMVSNNTLAALAVHLGLQHHMILDSPELSYQIRHYVSVLEARKQDEYRMAEMEARPPGQYWSSLEQPKPLSDLVESLIGALYVSDGFNPAGTEAFFRRRILPFYDAHIREGKLVEHPTKTLFELVQGRGCQKIQMINVDTNNARRGEDWSTAEVVIHDIVLSSATDITFPLASRAASAAALDALAGDPDFLTVCDCREKAQEAKRIEKAKAAASGDIIMVDAGA